jgi:hypothetical protein
MANASWFYGRTYWWASPPDSIGEDEDEDAWIPGDFQVYVTSYYGEKKKLRDRKFAHATEQIHPILQNGRRFVGNERQGDMSLSAPTVIIVHEESTDTLLEMFREMPNFSGPLLVVSVKTFEDDFDRSDFEILKKQLPDFWERAEFVVVWENLIGMSASDTRSYLPSFLRKPMSPRDQVSQRNAGANRVIRDWVRGIPPTKETWEPLADYRDEVSVGPFQVYLHAADLSYTRDQLLQQPLRTKVSDLLDSLVQEGEFFEGKAELPLLNREAPTIFVFDGRVDDDDLFDAFKAFKGFKGPLLFVQINPRFHTDRIDTGYWNLYYNFPYMKDAMLKAVASPLSFRNEGAYSMNLKNNSDIRKWIIKHARLMIKSGRKRQGDPPTDIERPEKRARAEAALRAFRGNIELAAAALARGLFVS